ncbi:hypothetical protein HQQ94_11350 [Shewanella sp. VB17]|uniref:hypothetical protein n=1 Tax=Shewanella sp. VB17 TaxID=2739432 RepID=UPI001566D0D8|nr:hypothetical protein [Shewanella sp. VB17]NRD73823.1 hypothetical protein [Shewanella sp. VB17]
MLKIKDEMNCVALSIEFDEYIPFTAEFECDSLSPPLYWRVGDGSLSLMEIGLNKNSGVVQSVTLTSIRTENIRKVSYAYVVSVSESVGLPIFDLSNWVKDSYSDEFANNFIDEFNVELDLILGQNFISVSIVDGKKPVRFINNNNVIFGIDAEDFLSNVDIINVSEENIKIIESAI